MIRVNRKPLGGTNAAPAPADRPKTMLHALRKVDLYPKFEQEAQVKTESGGFIFCLIAAVLLLLGMAELRAFWQAPYTDRILVDHTLDQKLRIDLDITFLAIPCRQVQLVAMDVAGENQLAFKSTIHKKRISRATGNSVGVRVKANVNGVDNAAGAPDVPVRLQKLLAKGYCGSCFGAETEPGDCCNSCDDLISAYVAKAWDPAPVKRDSEQCELEREFPHAAGAHNEGCNLEGHLLVNKVAGNFHVALGSSRSVNGRLVHQFAPGQAEHFNTSHQVNHLAFGHAFPGQRNPLAGHVAVVNPRESASGAYQYHIEVIPTIFSGRDTNQYAFTSSFTPIGEPIETEVGTPIEASNKHGASILTALPGVFFVYELSPFVINRQVAGRSWTEAFTMLCAVVGSLIAVSEIVDSIAFRFSRSSKK